MPYNKKYYEENREAILLQKKEYDSRPEVRAKKKEWDANRPRYEPDRNVLEKKCMGNRFYKCGRILNTFKENGEPDCFGVDKKNRDGLSNECRYCRFVYNINMKYGLSLEAYENWKVKQNNKCFICGIEFIIDEYGKDNSHVDHCHAADRTGLKQTQKCRAEDVRGLLCADCNKGLGFAKENVDTLQNMLYYIQEWKTLLQERK